MLLKITIACVKNIFTNVNSNGPSGTQRAISFPPILRAQCSLLFLENASGGMCSTCSQACVRVSSLSLSSREYSGLCFLNLYFNTLTVQSQNMRMHFILVG